MKECAICQIYKQGRINIVFKPGDWVWVDLIKERFPTQRKSKLMLHGDGPF